ncbi:phosphatidate cytidylyltransferase [Reinekea sp.]|uniref:phosphatidate cytidylyltransferase n=1 Tax=Reinekea sp. TaxID=1970455 RepID=UPI00257A61E8|nr:phosphatidate cytidylyltransferase [Reinekea sp.]MDO7642314.1 phosphatidate cytidylyltransferase [Reinekea forsetii]MDO7645059.1 phosphatidate cytidylyltransferase [Reinekea forsetii]
MLLQRFVTALVLAPLMLAGIYLLPSIGFSVFAGSIVVLGAWEWANLAGFSAPRARIVLATITAVVLGIIHHWITVDSLIWALLVLSALVFWLLAGVSVYLYPRATGWLRSGPIKLAIMVPVLVALWMGLVWLKSQPDSALLLTWLMLLVWGADIGAYFAGRAFGNRKLAPAVSPGKTWAGVYGGMATSILVSVLIAGLYLPDYSVQDWLWLMLLSAAVIAISVVGDLFESLLKRNRGIKDSSSLLPGHGGILDRIDSLCAATPMFVLLWYVLAVV